MKMNLKEHPELLPLVEWWEKDGKTTLAVLLAAAIAVLGWQGWKYHKASVNAEVMGAMGEAYTVEELEEAVSRFGGHASGGVFKFRLAKAYFSAERYEDALSIYTDLEAATPAGFEGVAAVGKAQCLEALEKYGEALTAFDAAAAGGGFLKLTAELGAARCICQSGDKAKALERLATVKKSLSKGDEMSKARVEATEDFVKRYVKREKRSLFDAADAAAKVISETAAPASPTNAPSNK